MISTWRSSVLEVTGSLMVGKRGRFTAETKSGTILMLNVLVSIKFTLLSHSRLFNLFAIWYIKTQCCCVKLWSLVTLMLKFL